jgi:hypothetical protein
LNASKDGDAGWHPSGVLIFGALSPVVSLRATTGYKL